VPTLDWEKTNLIVNYFTFEIPKTESLNSNPQGQLLTDNQGIEQRLTSPPEVIS
jgi:hypothetical protein